MKMKTRLLPLECVFVVTSLFAASSQAQPPPAGRPEGAAKITNTYAAKFICGVQFDRALDNIREAEAGRYTTEIDVHNNTGTLINVRKKIILLVQDPGPIPTQAKVLHVLKEDEVLPVVCRDIYKLLNFPIQVGIVPPNIQGLVIIEVFQPSGAPPPPKDPLDVEGIYTYRGELPVSPGGFQASDSGVSISVVVYPAKSTGHVMH
jgi:hypothetical protein